MLLIFLLKIFSDLRDDNVQKVGNEVEKSSTKDKYKKWFQNNLNEAKFEEMYADFKRDMKNLTNEQFKEKYGKFKQEVKNLFDKKKDFVKKEQESANADSNSPKRGNVGWIFD